MKHLPHTLFLLSAFIPSLGTASEATDSTITYSQPHRVTILCRNQQVDLHVSPQPSTVGKVRKVYPIRSLSVNGHPAATDSISFTSPFLLQVSDDTDLLRIDVRQHPEDESFAYSLTGVKVCNPSTVYARPTEQVSRPWPHRSQTVIAKHTRDKNKHDGIQFGGFQVGFVSALNAPSGMDIDMGASCEIGFEPIAYMRTNRSKTQHYSIGLAFNWRNYRMTGHTMFQSDQQGNTNLAPYPDDATTIQSSRIKVFSVGIPLRYGFNLPHHWGIDLEGALKFNTHASIESHYKVFDSEESVTHQVKESYKHIHPRKVTADVTLRLHWRSIGLYATYAPCQVLNPDFGPRFSTFTTGFTLFY